MSRAGEQGFTLLEMVCVIALIAMLAAVLLPFVPHHTSRSRLQAYALEAATLLKADRNAAIRRGADVSTLVDAASRAIRSGATAQTLRIPDDVRFDALLPQTCRQRPALSTVSFFADGMSCGGTIALARLDTAYEIRVNWLTGRIEIVSRPTLAN
ncbi:prepilin-type N-terminal cleavage/methylation domain-containing protein [Bradyrhizobium sp. NP1]|uniref:prepilin-type N-terminal cleavage/methylation domain-containing protein n=1 Tax=Bradyrhizobium sp. NP1 TaxID=3049772 RepID=UPI0025A57756|nr:prepilin-type N-terminal cleavage/methylation domain-containing protein [Bradyrhizobium sp. NP1]WJR79988.1 prepilin-type N-terminal cleavage/methylation domain-containing protein [Bradyrhizobium sp. NP1]